MAEKLRHYGTDATDNKPARLHKAKSWYGGMNAMDNDYSPIDTQKRQDKPALFQYGCLDLRRVLHALPRAVERVKKIVLGTPGHGFEDFGFLIHVAHFRNAEISA